MSDTINGTVRVRYWDREKKGGSRSTGVEFHGFNEAPLEVLQQIASTAQQAIARRAVADAEREINKAAEVGRRFADATGDGAAAPADNITAG